MAAYIGSRVGGQRRDGDEEGNWIADNGMNLCAVLGTVLERETDDHSAHVKFTVVCITVYLEYVDGTNDRLQVADSQGANFRKRPLPMYSRTDTRMLSAISSNNQCILIYDAFNDIIFIYRRTS